MARRGRKRNPNAKRHQKTRELRQPPDRGTPELQVKRRALVGENGDPNYSHSPISALYTRGIIEENQYNAGTIYTTQYWHMYGKPFGSIAGYEHRIASTIDEDLLPTAKDNVHRKSVFLSAERALHDAGERAVRLVKSMTAEHVYPRILTSEDITTIRRGLDALVGAYRCG